jgi:hypothetical protein
MLCVPTAKVASESAAELLVSGVKTDAAGGVTVGNKKTREGAKLPGRVIGTNGNAR